MMMISRQRLLPILSTLVGGAVTLLVPGLAKAWPCDAPAPPDTQACPGLESTGLPGDPSAGAALQENELATWPLRDRDPNATDCLGGERTGLWNSFGEIQAYSSENSSTETYSHTGLDLRSAWDTSLAEPLQGGAGDWAVLSMNSDIWHTQHYSNSDLCANQAYCRIVAKSNPSQRHILYYSHLWAAEGDGIHQDVRDAISTTFMWNQSDPVIVGSNPMCAGSVIAEMGPFTAPGFSPGTTHLHYSIVDAGDNYDGLNPLIYHDDPQNPVEPQGPGLPYVDETDPTIYGLYFADCDESLGAECVDTQLATGCEGDELSGEVDLVILFEDQYHVLEDPELTGQTTHVGPYKASYRIRLAPGGNEQDGTLVDQVWYEYDRAPFECRGPVRGLGCTDPDATPIDETYMLGWFNSGFHLMQEFSNRIYSVADTIFPSNEPNLYSWSSTTSPGKMYAVLTNAWGYEDGSWDTTQYPDGLYQVSAYTWDEEGNVAQLDRFVKVRNTANPFPLDADVVLRDNTSDTGAEPSNPNQEKHWRSPDIKVLPIADPMPDVDSAIWDEIQPWEISGIEDYNIWVRAQNIGCGDAQDVEITVGSALAGMANTDFTEIGTAGPTQLDGATSESGKQVFGPIAWSPSVAEQEHRCMVAIADSPSDPENTTFVDIVKGADGDVPNSNNIAQRNYQLLCDNCDESSNIAFANPTDDPLEISLGWDCNDFPIYESTASAFYTVDYHPALAAAWANVPRTTLVDDGSTLELHLHGCKIEMPPAMLPANTSLQGVFKAFRPFGDSDEYIVDLYEKTNDVVLGGFSVLVTGLIPQ